MGNKVQVGGRCKGMGCPRTYLVAAGQIAWVGGGDVLSAHGAEERSDIPKERGPMTPVNPYCVLSYNP